MEQNTLDLLQLPDEVLRYVLSFIPYRFEVSQVCKKFYELVCDMDKNKYMLKARTNHWRGEVRMKTNHLMTFKIYLNNLFSFVVVETRKRINSQLTASV